MQGRKENDVRIVVSTGKSQGFRWNITFILDQLGVDYLVCDDLFSAMAEAANPAGGKTIAVVNIDNSVCELGDFMRICSQMSNVRCCYLIKCMGVEYKNLIADIISSGQQVVLSERELGKTLKAMIDNFDKKSGDDLEVCSGQTQSNVFSEQISLSKEELNAILGFSEGSKEDIS